MKVILKILIGLMIIPSIMLWFYDSSSIELREENIYILNDVSENVLYSQISDNTYKCDITAVSNIINQLLLEEWSLTRLNVEEETLDAIFEKENVVYRIYYESSGTLTLLASPYEKSKEIGTYINDKK